MSLAAQRFLSSANVVPTDPVSSQPDSIRHSFPSATLRLVPLVHIYSQQEREQNVSKTSASRWGVRKGDGPWCGEPLDLTTLEVKRAATLANTHT